MHYQYETYGHIAAAAATHPQRPPPMPDAARNITSYTRKDVLNGRGQGVQRHPGNTDYRMLVSVNKVLYAQCPKSDKTKISKGIVAAIRQHGGRFLELDERTGIYDDIGDKKATEKTSQALREGQTKIRRKMYHEEKVAGVPAPGGSGREVSAEGYLLYSSQVLQSLCHAAPPTSGLGDGANADALVRAREQSPGAAMLPSPPLPPPRPAATPHPKQPTAAERPTPPSLGGRALDRGAQRADIDAFARVREQFPGAAMLPPPPPRPAATPYPTQPTAAEWPTPPALGGRALDRWAQRADMDAFARVREQFPGAAMLPPPPPRPGATPYLTQPPAAEWPTPSAPGGRALDRWAQRAGMDAFSRVREQFPGAAMLSPPLAVLSPRHPPSVRPPLPPPQLTLEQTSAIFSTAQDGTRVSDLMDMSVGTVSLAQMLEARNGDWDCTICDLVRLSAIQWEPGADLHIDTEVPTLANDGHTSRNDRISELRYADLSMNPDGYRPAAPADFHNARNSLIDASIARNSLMDASIMTIGTGDMSRRSSLEEIHRQSDSTGGSNERDTAESLMRLSTNVKHRKSQ